jgi:hypothetical protein
VSESQSDLSILNNTTDAVIETVGVTSVTLPLQAAETPRRFPRSATQPVINTNRDADLLLRPSMLNSDSEFYLACSGRRRNAIRQWYLENLLFLHRRLLLEVISEDWQRCFRLKAAVDRVGPHTSGHYMNMTDSAAGPTTPFVEA